jgi:DNA polymerase III subunit epsilon
MPISLQEPWKNATFVSFDTETTGAYPLESEVCEVAGVKWKDGKIIDEFQSLVKISKPMSDFIIGIHGITNEMCVDAPAMKDVIRKFHEFSKDTILVAHHAPFDIGFLTLEMEKCGLVPTDLPTICTSLLSRKVFPNFANHKLQTLIPLLGITQGTAHRALDDSRACLQVALKCMEKVGPESSLEKIFETQGIKLFWKDYSMQFLRQHDIYGLLVLAIEAGRRVEIGYRGTAPEQKRPVMPIGIVRSPDGDYLVGFCEREQRNKRYYLNRIASVSQLLV